MSIRNLSICCSFKQAHIIKHALRDMPNKTPEELRTLEVVTEEIDWFREKYRIPKKKA